MGMTIENCIKELLINKEDDTYVLGNETINFAVDTMRKYQQIVQIYQKWNEVNDFSYNQAMQKIGEVVEDGRN